MNGENQSQTEARKAYVEGDFVGSTKKTEVLSQFVVISISFQKRDVELFILVSGLMVGLHNMDQNYGIIGMMLGQPVRQLETLVEAFIQRMSTMVSSLV